MTRPCRVLDAGCGGSVFPLFLAGRGHRVTACDLAPTPAIHAYGAAGIEFVQSDLVSLPFPDSMFDVLFCISVIEHLPLASISLALATLQRVLRPGGILLLTTDYYRNAEEEIRYDGPGSPFRVDWNIFDPDRLHRFILSAKGFAVCGPVDLAVDWETVSPRMRAFHGYPYTAVGIKMIRV